jgi:hypothetical protein
MRIALIEAKYFLLGERVPKNFEREQFDILQKLEKSGIPTFYLYNTNEEVLEYQQGLYGLRTCFYSKPSTLFTVDKARFARERHHPLLELLEKLGSNEQEYDWRVSSADLPPCDISKMNNQMLFIAAVKVAGGNFGLFNWEMTFKDAIGLLRSVTMAKEKAGTDGPARGNDPEV